MFLASGEGRIFNVKGSQMRKFFILIAAIFACLMGATSAQAYESEDGVKCTWCGDQ